MNKQYLRDKLEEYIYELKLSEYAAKTLIDYRQAVDKFINFIETDEFNLNKELLLTYRDYLQ